MLIDDYLKRVEQAIIDNDQSSAMNLFEEIVRVYSGEISDIEKGTTALQARINMVWNLNFNDPKDMLNTDVDYINDLKVILPKLQKHSDEQKTKTPKTNIYNDSSINITDSSVSNSNIGHNSTVKEEKGKYKIIFSIIAALAGIATIIGTIFAILHQLGKI